MLIRYLSRQGTALDVKLVAHVTGPRPVDFFSGQPDRAVRCGRGSVGRHRAPALHVNKRADSRK